MDSSSTDLGARESMFGRAVGGAVIMARSLVREIHDSVLPNGTDGSKLLVP